MAWDLTKEQRNIVEATEGFVRCGAVPGSGKTACITHRMAYLVRDLYVDPSAVVALTFTNKAAGTMKRRLKSMIGDEATCFTGTFHGFCNKILKEEIYRLSYPKEFTILDKQDQIDLIKEVTDELGLSLRDFTAKEYLEDIDERKFHGDYVELMMGSDKDELLRLAGVESVTEGTEVEGMVSPEGMQESVEEESDEQEKSGEAKRDVNHLDKVYYNYLLKQRDNYVLDFNDIIEFAIYILQNYKDARELWQDKCMYLLCDEYQDVNSRQELLLSILSGKYGNLTVVGDDDQCIYGWRGSEVDYIVNFHTRYGSVRDYYLSENFRSTPEIVAVANSLIKANSNRLVKNMFTNNPSGDMPTYYEAQTEKAEALWIADMIRASHQDDCAHRADYISQADEAYQAVKVNKEIKEIKASQAVLVRASSQVRALEEAFVLRKIPYKVLSGAQFYGAEEIKTVLSYLRMIYSLGDLDFVYTINRPKRGYGKKSIEALKAEARTRNCSLFEALGCLIEEGSEKRKSVVSYYQGVRELHNSYDKHSCKQLAGMVLDLGYRKELEDHVDQRRLDNLVELLSTIEAMEKDNQEPIALPDLLSHFALFTAQDDDTRDDVVKIMTIHTAKGLEFDSVFVSGLVEGQFPSNRLRNVEEFEEERRLFYVAITRAKKHLHLSGYKSKTEGYPVRQSAFLSNIEPDLVNCIADSTIAPAYAMPMAAAKQTYEVGDLVVHKAFGPGTITAVDHDNKTYDIEFENVSGIRRIQFRAELRKI